MTTLLTMKGFNKKIDYLCFTANTANSTIKLTQNGSPTSVTLETSTDGSTRTAYTIGSAITLSNIGDKVYWRNTSETTTGFSKSVSSYYHFVMTGSISASGDVNYLLCKNSTDTISYIHCFYMLFNNCSITTTPRLPATTIYNYCYASMFRYCTSLVEIPKLPAIKLKQGCYSGMFYNCSSIKLSTTQTGEYVNEYRIPITGTGTNASNSMYGMFTSTGGAFTGSPKINTTYYTSNQVI